MQRRIQGLLKRENISHAIKHRHKRLKRSLPAMEKLLYGCLMADFSFNFQSSVSAEYQFHVLIVLMSGDAVCKLP
jgi:hypothetical protein